MYTLYQPELPLILINVAPNPSLSLACGIGIVGGVAANVDEEGGGEDEVKHQQ